MIADPKSTCCCLGLCGRFLPACLCALFLTCFMPRVLAAEPRAETAELDGTWLEVIRKPPRIGYSPPRDPVKLAIRSKLLVEEHGNRVFRQSLFKVIPGQNLEAIDLITVVDGEFWLTRAILKVKDDTLTICEGGRDQPRPSEFRDGESVEDKLTLLRSFMRIVIRNGEEQAVEKSSHIDHEANQEGYPANLRVTKTPCQAADKGTKPYLVECGAVAENVTTVSTVEANARTEIAGARVVRSASTGEVALDVCGGRDKVYLQEVIDPMNINLLWSVRPVGEYVMFVSHVNDMALDANVGTGNPYPRVANPSNINHLWLLAKIGDDYMIWSAVSNVVLDANGGRGRPYLSVSPDPRNVNHRWELRRIGNDYILIPRVRLSNNGSDDPLTLGQILPFGPCVEESLLGGVRTQWLLATSRSVSRE